MYLLFKILKCFFIGLSSSLKKWSVNGDSGELFQCDWMVVSEQLHWPPVLNPSKHLCLAVTQGIVAKVTLWLNLLLPVSSLKQGSTEASAIKEYVEKHSLPLVGHRKTSNDAKRYTKRPLVVVYYSVDFSFDYRTGETPYEGLSGMGANTFRILVPEPLKLVVWMYFIVVWDFQF